MTAGQLEQTLEQTNYNLYIRWQAVRRDPEYRAFCDKYNQYFDDDGVMRWELLPTEDAEKEADHIKETYGLDQALSQATISIGLEGGCPPCGSITDDHRVYKTPTRR